MMKQKYLSLLITITILILSICEIAAQPSQYDGLRRNIGKGGYVTTIDSAKLRITYSLNYLPDSAQSQKVMKDRKVLLIGKEWTHFYSYYVRQADSALTADWDRGKNSAPLKRAPDIAGEGYEVFTHLPTQQRTVLEPITNLSLYRYKEPVETLQWEISNDTCRILSYLCQKATARFRGRDWIVWFSPEIPLNTGPWKLGGLPGLIMKAADSRNHYVFECTGIEQLRKAKQPVVMRQAASYYNKCTRAEYRKAQKQFYDNHVNVLLSLGYNVSIWDDAGKQVDFLTTPNTMFAERKVSLSTNINVADRYKKIPYNPIELE